MGCCLTTATAAGDNHHHHHLDSKQRAPPPPPEEEETVKEVLSETPIISDSTPTKTNHQNDVVPFTKNPTQEFTPANDVVPFNKYPIEEFSSANDVVPFTKNPVEETYTYSESFSAATTTTTTSFATDLRIDEDGEVTQKLNKNNRTTAKTLPRKHPPPTTTTTAYSGRRRERRVGPPPPARRPPIPSSDKKIQLPSRNITTTQRHRNAVPSNVVRREPPARRSRSPAMRGEEGHIRKVKERSPVRKSGDRVPVNLTENKGNLKLKKTADGGVVPEPEPEMETCESLENPLVSLECFIFL